MTYSTAASAYLERARRECASGQTDRLFYAAFELRAGIEARLQEYLEHAGHVPDGRKRDWRIAKLGLSTSKAFGVEQIARVQFLDQRTHAPYATFFYTPVSPELRRLGERLGDYLHAREYRAEVDPWWGSLRTTLEVGCHLLEEATTGTLLGPPILNSRTGQTYMPMEVTSQELLPKKGDEILMDIRYFDSLAEARGDAA